MLTARESHKTDRVFSAPVPGTPQSRIRARGLDRSGLQRRAGTCIAAKPL